MEITGRRLGRNLKVLRCVDAFLQFQGESHLLMARTVSAIVLTGFFIMTVAHAADVTCLPVPLPRDIAIYVTPQPPVNPDIGCVTPLPCVTAPQPTVTNWPGNPTQELKITASPVSGGQVSEYHSVYLWAQKLNAGTWENSWAAESTDAVNYASNNTITFGATGLKLGETYQFKIGWCKLFGTTQSCDCYSIGGYNDANSDGTADAIPTTFPTPPIPLPSGTTQEAEDRFQRPVTTPKRNSSGAVLGGDGLGPAVWSDDVSGGYGAHIATDANGSFAAIPANSQEIYLLSDAQNKFNYAETEFAPYCTSTSPNPPNNTNCSSSATNYRFDTQTRLLVIGGALYGYDAQALYEPDWASGVTTPTLRVFRSDGGAATDLLGSEGTPVSGTPAYDPSTGVGCIIDGNNVPADDTNTYLLRNGSRMLVRIEVKQNTENQPVVTTTWAWDCDGSTCDKQCIWKVTDSNIGFNHPLKTAKGSRGFLSHHWAGRVNAFRAGSGVQQ